jgi:glucose uptake protein GlcU
MYSFPHFAGIFLTSALVFVVYAAASCNKPRVYAQTSLPALASGVIWAIAQIGFFYGNEALGQSISFPIIAVGPSLVGALWGSFVFGEIKGQRNFILLAIAFCFVTGAALCIALSK